jgi:hypothetical protein
MPQLRGNEPILGLNTTRFIPFFELTTFKKPYPQTCT